MEEKCEGWDSWFHRTFGIVGPLISSLFGLIILALVILATDFVNIHLGSGFLSDVQTFLLANIGLFFLIFLFFSYTSYFSRAYPKTYILFSPVVMAFGVMISLWIVMHAITNVNLYFGNSLF